MKQLLLAPILMLSLCTFAQGVKADKEVLCFPLKSFLKEIKEKYKEEPTIIGKTAGLDGVVTVWYINTQNGNFTVVEMDDEAACVISVGTKSHYRLPKSGPTA